MKKFYLNKRHGLLTRTLNDQNLLLKKKKALLFLVTFFLLGGAYAQGMYSAKIASKKPIDSKIPKIQQHIYQLRSAVTCDTSYFYCENYEGVSTPNLPSNMSTSSNENNYYVPFNGNNIQVDGFYTGNSDNAGVGGYWTVPEHTQFAMTNDDACLPGGATPGQNNNCDLNFEVLELPSLDFTQGDSGMWIQFEYYHDKLWGGGDAKVEVSTDGGANFTDISGNLPESQSWQFGAFSLSAYSQESDVKIRFTWSDNGNWASGFAVDDIIVNPLPDYAANLNEVYHLFPSSYFGGTKYTIAPLAQAEATAYNFSGIIKNVGLNTLDSARLYASITSESFSTQSNGLNTLSLALDTFYCNDVFTPTATGSYQADIYCEDENGTQTETKSTSFMVSEFEFARDEAGNTSNYTGGSYINNEGSEQRGNIFDIYKEATLYAIKARIHPATTPSCMAKAIINFVDPSNGDISYLDETDLIDVGAMTDDWVNFIFNNPVQLSAGNVVLATIFAELDTDGLDTLVLAQNGTSKPGESLLQDIDGTDSNGDPGDWYYTTNTPMVRLNFEEIITIKEHALLDFTLYPNPNQGIFKISINSSETHTLMAHNMIGQVVHSEKVKHGTSSIDLSHLEKGIYTISLSSLTGISTNKKIIIQ
jgi:hypothetical protein